MNNEPKGDVVVKLSQPFTSVLTAEDKDLVFSSGFPLLKEEKSGNFLASSLPGTSTNYIPVVTHNLNYHPFFLVYEDSGGGHEMKLGADWAVDNSTLYVRDQSASGATQFSWSIYRLPLYEKFESATTLNRVTTSSLYDGRFVIKTAKEGKDINSTDLRDFTIHSRARSPLIHSVNPKDWAGSDIIQQIDPGLPYNPICFGFAQVSGKSFNMMNGGQATPYLSRTNGLIKIVSSPSTSARTSIIILKDPFIAPKTFEVTY